MKGREEAFNYYGDTYENEHVDTVDALEHSLLKDQSTNTILWLHMLMVKPRGSIPVLRYMLDVAAPTTRIMTMVRIRISIASISRQWASSVVLTYVTVMDANRNF